MNDEKTQGRTSTRSLTPQEKSSIEQVKKRGVTQRAPFFRAADANQEGVVDLAWDNTLNANDALDQMMVRVAEATGVVNQRAGVHLLSLVAEAVSPANAEANVLAIKLNAVAQTMASMSPQDEHEGQLIAQLVVLHEHAMTWLGKAARTERVDFANVYLNGASKLLARHHETLEALLRYRRKGEQRVHVEHVHVHEGGQAIVGNVTTGGGHNQKSEEGPHAKV